MKKIIHIKGMHCVSCELILEKGLKKIPWAEFVMVNHKKWILEIDSKNQSDYDAVVTLIEKSGFRVVEEWESKTAHSPGDTLWNIIAILLVIILFMFTQIFDLYSYLPDTSSMNYSSAFLVWIIA